MRHRLVIGALLAGLALPSLAQARTRRAGVSESNPDVALIGATRARSAGTCANGAQSGRYLCVGDMSGVDFYAFFGTDKWVYLKLINTTGNRLQVDFTVTLSCHNGSVADPESQEVYLKSYGSDGGGLAGLWFAGCGDAGGASNVHISNVSTTPQ